MTERSLGGPSKPLLLMPCCAAAGTRARCFPARKSLLKDSRQRTAPTRPTAASSHSPTAKSCLSAHREMEKDRRSNEHRTMKTELKNHHDYRRTFDYLQHQPGC